MSTDDWTRVAASNDALVADLLLGLKHSNETWTLTTKTLTQSDSLSGSLTMFRWGRRKARSSHAVTRFVNDKEYNKRATRSPTTPLSWSGGTSASGSGNVDGYEASSMMCYRSPPSRSKTYVEPKEEEGLLQERQILKRDLPNLYVTMAHYRNANKNLKRIKRVSVQSKRIKTSNMLEASTLQGFPSLFTPHNSRYDIPSRTQGSNSSVNVSAVKGDGELFVLPDLNMLPSIDEEPF